MSTESSEDIDWYKILGCTLGSSREVIEKAARKLSAKFHPDKNPDPAAAPVFLKIQKAKDFLLDDEKRKEYDDKIPAETKSKIEADIAALKQAMEGDDVENIKAKTESLMQSSMSIGEMMYKDQQPQAENASNPDSADSAKVVDAEFEEVKEDEDKK